MKHSRYGGLLAVILLASCYGTRTVPYKSEEMLTQDKDVLVTPLDIPIDYEVVGQVTVTKEKRSSDIKGLYKELGGECRKMGGDMVINVQASQEVEDTRKGYSLPKGYGESPYGSGLYTVPYGLVKGTVIRIRDEDKRKAYWNAREKGNPADACTIVGLPYP